MHFTSCGTYQRSPHAMLFFLLFPLLVLPTTVSATSQRSSNMPDYTISAPDSDGVPRFEPSKCGFDLTKDQKEGTNVNCGYVVVPEQHENPSGPIIRLAIARFKAADQTSSAEPIIYLEGGPGGVALGSSTGTYAAHFTAANDFIIFDQRGVGHSQPALTCPETITQDGHEFTIRESAAEQNDHLVSAFIRCHDRLAQRYNLAAYNSAENAADVNDIRVALGYEKVKLFGVSYGSRLALTVMRDFPQIVSSALIDAVSPPQTDQYADLAGSFSRSLDLLFAGCAADQACNTAFPTLKADFTQTVMSLDSDPLTIATSDTTSGAKDRSANSVILTGARLMEYTQQYLYSASIIRYLPMLIEQLRGRDTSLFRSLLRAYSNRASISDGMSWSVWCNDYVPFSNRDQAVTAAQELPSGVQTDFLPTVLSAYAVCAQWGSPPPNPIEHQAVISDVPTLVLASVNDPVTPPSYAQQAMQTLSRGIYVEGPTLGHSVTGNSGDCGVKIILDFFANPGLKPDTSCLNTRAIRFLSSIKQYPSPPPLTIDTTKKYTATMVTTKGTITFDLFANVAPQTVNNFVFLANDHFFDGMDFYSIAPGYGIGTGDPTGLGNGGPGYMFQDEPIPAGLDYERGIIAMSNSGPDTNGSLFAIISSDLRGKLAKKYTIFGNVSNGIEVVDQILAWKDSVTEPAPMVVTVTVQMS